MKFKPELPLPQPFKITEIRVENPSTKTFVLDGAVTAQPGQFVMAWRPDQPDKPFSLAGADPLSLTVAAVGPFSRALHGLRVGDRLWVRGPLGRGYRLAPPTRPNQSILLIGGGYGVAPLHFLAGRALAQGYRVGVIIGARSQAQLMFVAAFEALGLRVTVTTEDGSAGQRGLVTDALAPILQDDSPSAVYTCGPTGMLQAVAARCGAAGNPVQVGWEAHMRCGIGLCGSCEVGQGWLTCLDGPVFPFDPQQVGPEEAGE